MRDPVVQARQPPELGHDVAAERRVRALRELEPGQLGDLVEVLLAVQFDHAVRPRWRGSCSPAPSSSRDVADDLLDEVLERDDAVRAAVLVDDDREVLALAAHLRQRGEHPLGRRHHLHLAGDVGDRAVALAAVGEDAGRGCGRTPRTSSCDSPDDRVALVRRLGRELDRPADRHRAVEEDDLGARHHDLADRALTRGEDVVDQAPLVRGQRLVRRDQPAQLVLADRLAARRSGRRRAAGRRRWSTSTAAR